MGEIIKMLVVLTLISTVSGAALGALNEVTTPFIKQAEFDNKVKPTLETLLPEYDNNLVEDQFTVERKDGKQINVYPAKKGGELVAMGYDAVGKGYGGELKLMVVVDIKENMLKGMGVVSHAETPGLGARATEESFQEQFRNLPFGEDIQLKANGGNIDAISGATITSNAVVNSINSAFDFFDENKQTLMEKSE